jgi:hypothetical protein
VSTTQKSSFAANWRRLSELGLDHGLLGTYRRPDPNFRVADNPAIGPSMTTSALAGTDLTLR